MNRESRQRTRKEDEDSEVGRGGSPRRLVATGARKKLNREPRERTLREEDFFNHNGSAADMDELTISNPSSNHTNGHG